MLRLTGNSSERVFLNDMMNKSGQRLLECLQCGKCTGSCPVASPETGGPRQLIAQILAGMKDHALTNPMWWYCVSCGSCVTRCPVDINVYELATALCETAAREGITPSEREIHLFEDLFLKSVRKYGRVKELRTVALFNLMTMNPLKDMDKGIALMKKGAIGPLEIFRAGKKDDKVERIFKRVESTREGE
ncbi:MAG: 4Fe-4S dicluster domain-containing protein [Desulfomonilaceae bacterium]|nr:4Fe-4S dicluster domain-containing protein [Desulfomonilaceae bacterium]